MVEKYKILIMHSYSRGLKVDISKFEILSEAINIHNLVENQSICSQDIRIILKVYDHSSVIVTTREP